MATPNYSLLSIPAYMIIAMMPHAYSVWLITSHNNNRWDLACPRSSQNHKIVESTVPKDVHRKYERCRAAHDNMMENMAFVIGGILSGVITKLDANWMNTVSGVYLASRILYSIVYIQTSSLRWSSHRTLWYLVGNVAILATYWKAGMLLVREGNLP